MFTDSPTIPAQLEVLLDVLHVMRQRRDPFMVGQGNCLLQAFHFAGKLFQELAYHIFQELLIFHHQVVQKGHIDIAKFGLQRCDRFTSFQEIFF